MRTTLKYLSVCCAACTLLACADTGKRAAPEPAAAAAFGSADDAYLVGRSQHMAMHYDDAIASYQAALQLMPQHVNARNGLATLYAERGEFDKAIPLWQALTATAAEQAGPESAFLFSNLGYAQFLVGDYENALAALEKACVLDPLNARAWEHLGSALDKLGQHERAQLMYKQSAALQAHDFKADYALAPKAGVAAIDSAVQANAGDDAQYATTKVQQTGSGMFVMRRIPAHRHAHGTILAAAAPVAPVVVPTLPASVPAPLPAALPAGTAALVEIRNGNGVTGMARSLAGTMDDGQLRVVRLTNQKGFGVKRTRVEYQPEFREAAERLAERFGAAKVVPVAKVGRADVRLVIGHDLVGKRPVAAALAANPAMPRKES